MHNFKKTKRRTKRALLHFIIYLLVIIIIFPFLWIAICAIQPLNEMLSLTPSIIPKHFTLSNFSRLFTQTNYLDSMKNSVIIAISSTLLTTIFATYGGYALSRFRFKGKDLIAQLILFSYVIPSILLVIPMYVMFVRIGIINTRFGLIVANVSFAVPFAIWMLRGFFATLPDSLEDSAMVDGCSRFGTIFRIILPISLPGISATAIFSFLSAWNEFLFSMSFISEKKLMTLQPVVANFVSAHRIEWDLVMASGTITSLPIILYVVWFQKYLISGLTAGAVKE